jgi:DNA-binding GntR family transcriptional regulator
VPEPTKAFLGECPVAFEGSKTLAEQIVNRLATQIIRAELPPGERILEVKLAAELGVSRSPVREAFRMLEKSRLIEVLPHRGARVTELSSSSIRWLFDIIEEFYVLLARKAAELGNEEDRRNVRTALEKMECHAEIDDSQAYYRSMLDFSYALQSIVKNPMLDKLMKDIEPSLRRTLYATIPKRSENLKENARMVERITQAVERGDVKMADSSVRAYIQHERQLALKVFGENSQTQTPAD